MRVSIIIPVYNEEESIGYVLERIPDRDQYEIIVVDGGSTDRTVEIARSYGAREVDEPRRGYGRACSTGLNHASGDIVVFLDGDGADDPTQIPDLIKHLNIGQKDMALGSRLAGDIQSGAMPWHQRFGNQLSAGLIRILYKLPITDLSPFRAVKRDKLLSIDVKDMTYGWPTEMICKAARNDWRIVEIPVNYHRRYGGRSKISGTVRGTVLATYHIITTILKYAWN